MTDAPTDLDDLAPADLDEEPERHYLQLPSGIITSLSQRPRTTPAGATYLTRDEYDRALDAREARRDARRAEHQTRRAEARLRVATQLGIDPEDLDLLLR